MAYWRFQYKELITIHKPLMSSATLIHPNHTLNTIFHHIINLNHAHLLWTTPIYSEPRPSTLNHAHLLWTTPIYSEPRPSTLNHTHLLWTTPIYSEPRPSTLNHAHLLGTTPIYSEPRPSTLNHAHLLGTTPIYSEPRPSTLNHAQKKHKHEILRIIYILAPHSQHFIYFGTSFTDVDNNQNVCTFPCSIMVSGYMEQIFSWDLGNDWCISLS